MCYGCENALSSMKHKKSFLSIECYHKYVIRQTEVVQLQSMSFCFFFCSFTKSLYKYISLSHRDNAIFMEELSRRGKITIHKPILMKEHWSLHTSAQFRLTLNFFQFLCCSIPFPITLAFFVPHFTPNGDYHNYVNDNELK